MDHSAATYPSHMPSALLGALAERVAWSHITQRRRLMM
nr:hypothetical protein [Kibdelosporangium sp. MJ126-NF4]CTQ97623.1 hypothetical protein [Kibdelosporangium sp. MJ126-NF4]